MDKLSKELRQVEEQLRASRSDQPGPELRQRVFAEVGLVLAGQQRRDRRWAFAVAVAASVLFWMNVSISATTPIDHHAAAAKSAEVDRLAADIHELLPELSAAEARRYAFLHSSIDTMALRPDLPWPSITQDGFLRLSN